MGRSAMAPARRWRLPVSALCVAALLPGGRADELLHPGGRADELLVPLPHGGKVALSTRGPSAFRVRVLADDRAARPIDSPMVGPDAPDAAATEHSDDDGKGLKAKFGEVKVTASGELHLFNADGDLLFSSAPLGPGDKEWSLSKGKDAKLYGRGASPDDCGSLSVSAEVQPLVCNRATYAPYYYSSDGYGALGVVEHADYYKLPLTYSAAAEHVKWKFDGAFELYLIPAASMELGTQAYYQLLGAPRIPPRYAFGFMASRWGWEGQQYMEDVMAKFRSDHYPIDGIICDFEWFTNESDYSYDPQGKTYYRDFGYNPPMFPDPKAQLTEYQKNGFHVGGIRKPRLGNTDLLNMARDKGWILPHGEPSGSWPPNVPGAYAKERSLDFTQKEVRDWYSHELEHFTEEGVDFWWNDEGETEYFTFHWWNVAQVQSLLATEPTRRFYSLNRAWSPGMARLGAAVWTGDVNPTWVDLEGTPGMMLNWVLAGAPYVACDIGGFTGQSEANLLTRWMQVGVFMPIMRVHSTKDATPHFPWLWGEKAAAAMRHALEVRYRLVPYHYSLAHRLYRSSAMWIKPLSAEFPDDPDVAEMTTQWMDGSILVAPILGQNSRRTVYLPSGTWYPLRASSSTMRSGDGPIEGPKHLDGTGELDEMPCFVRPGTVLPLAPVVQSTLSLPGGALEVQVYAGADGSFDLVEDDGTTRAYEAGQSRTTRFVWNDAHKILSWSLEGFVLSPGDQAFKEIFVTLISRDGLRQSDTWDLGITGSIAMDEDQAIIA